MKKKILSMLLVLCMVATLLPTVSLKADAMGPALTSGTTITSGTTYTINNAVELGYLAAIVNAGQNCTGATFKLTANIDLNVDITFTFVADTGLVTVTKSGTTFYLGTGIKGTDCGSSSNTNFDTAAGTVGTYYGSNTPTDIGSDTIGLNTWTPISNAPNHFDGTFDGQGHTVSGVYLNNTLDFQGLFGYVTGTVKNVGVANSYIKGGNSSYWYIGGIAGFCYGGTVINCWNSGSVCGYKAIGGIVGGVQLADSNVNNCYNTGTVSGCGLGGGAFIGGIVGVFYSGNVNNCYNTGIISSADATNGYYVGGIVGLYDASLGIAGCYYLADCATDGQSVGQKGMGVASIGTAATDVNGKINVFAVGGTLSNASDYTITNSAGTTGQSIAAGSTLFAALNTWVKSATYNTWTTTGYPTFGALFVPTYTMSASTLTAFASQTLGYTTAPTAQTVTITNTGDQAITLQTAFIRLSITPLPSRTSQAIGQRLPSTTWAQE